MKTRIARALSLGSYLGLTLFIMSWIMFLGGVEERQISIWLLLFVTPLLLPLRGILAGRDKAMVWGTLVSLLYMVHGGMEAWASADNGGLGWIEATLALTYLVSAGLFVRWRAEQLAEE